MAGELRRGPWTVEEDLLLVNYVASHGEGRWNSLARSAGGIHAPCRITFWVDYLSELHRQLLEHKAQFMGSILSHHPPITRCLPIASPPILSALPYTPRLDKDVTLHLLHANMETDSCLAMSLAAIQLTEPTVSEKGREFLVVSIIPGRRDIYIYSLPLHHASCHHIPPCPSSHLHITNYPGRGSNGVTRRVD